MSALRDPARHIPVLLAALVLAVSTATISPWPVGVFQDDGIYAILAKALAAGEGYVYLNIPGHPPATHYPPGYPALLAVLWKVFPEFPENLVLLKFANALLLAATAAGAYRLARAAPGLPRAAAAACALFGALTIPALVLAGMLLSETLFLAMLFPALLLAERTVDRPTPRGAVAVGLLCGALALVRTLGVVLLPVVLALLVRRRARLAALLVVASALVALLPWQLWIAAHPLVLPPELHGKYGSYGPWLLAGYEQQGAGFVVRVLGRNVREVFSMLRFLFAPSLPEAARILAATVVLGISGVGLGRLARRAPATAGFVTLYMAVVLVWPFSPVRFVWGIWSLFAIVMAAGVVVVLAWHPPARGARLARGLLLLSAALVVLGHTVYNIRGYRGAWWDSIPRDVARDAAPLVRWVLEHTRPGDVLATDHETLLYLYSGRQAVPLEDFSAAEYVAERTPAQQLSALTGILSAYNVSYLLAPRAATVQAALHLARTTPPRLDVVGALPAGGTVFAPPGL